MRLTISADSVSAMLTVNLKFPAGCKENYKKIEDLPVLPRAGDFIQGAEPGSGRYRVRAVVFEVAHQIDDKCISVLVELEALDEMSS